MSNFLKNFPQEFNNQFKPTENSIICPVCKNRISCTRSEIILDFICCNNMFSYFEGSETYFYYFKQTNTYEITTKIIYCLNDRSLTCDEQEYDNIQFNFLNYPSVLKTIELLAFYQ